jgi:ankyrin repeat protein
VFLNLQMSDTTILSATKTNDAAAVRTLIENGADLNVQDGEEQTPLIIATKCNYIEIARLLIEAGANLNIQDNCGMTALVSAICEETAIIAELLIKAGADLEIESPVGTALAVAIYFKSVEIATQLLRHGANANCTIMPDTAKEEDILDFATMYDMDEISELILQNRTSPIS